MKRTLRILSTLLIFALLLLPACSLNGEESGTAAKKSYSVSSSYFGEVDYEKHVLTDVNLQTSTTAKSYEIELISKCFVSLYKYNISATFYDSDMNALSTFKKEVEKDVAANDSIEILTEVSYSVYSTINSVSASLTGSSYEDPSAISVCSVTFVPNNGSSNFIRHVVKGKAVSMPQDPVRDNYIFTGWYSNSSLSDKYDFSESVSSDTKLYAGYELDAATITNSISMTQIKSLVKVYNKCYDTFLGIETSSSTSQGSGFCFKVSNGCYFILTNCHVAKKNSDYSKQKYTIEDYDGTTYEGYLYKNSNKSYSAIAADYDLACLYFKSSSTDVVALDIASNPEVSDDVISLGAPNGQTNYITYGTVLSYGKITLSNTDKSLSNVTFDVIQHTAYIDSGSSGGPILNSDLKVVGINYAGNSKTGSASYSRSYAIPASKINEFLNKYVYT